MSAYNAPTYIVSIYNPVYFESNTANLTQSQANALYLQKTTADTATALETFSSGISTNSIATTSAASTLDIASSSTGVINIGIAGGRSNIIHIGDGNSNVAGGAVHINNGTNSASNVQILNGAGSTGTITLGSTTSTLTINSPTSLGYTTGFTASSSQIGYRATLVNGLTATAGTTTSVGQSFNLPVGIWIVQASAQALTSASFITMSISTSTSAHDSSRWCIVANAGANPTLTINTTIINATSAAVGYNVLVQAAVASVSIGTIYVFATRIA